MKTLLVLRHAKSSWKDESLTDHERPLNQRGIGDAPVMGKLLRKQELVPELIISSSAKRALATAKLVAEACGYEEKIAVSQDFYMGDPDDYFGRLRLVPDNLTRVMIVGHNPGMEELVADLTGHYERLPTAALAEIELPVDSWMQLTGVTEGRLVNLWHPRGLSAS